MEGTPSEPNAMSIGHGRPFEARVRLDVVELVQPERQVAHPPDQLPSALRNRPFLNRM